MCVEVIVQRAGYLKEHLFVLPITIWLLVISHDACSCVGVVMHSPLWAGMHAASIKHYLPLVSCRHPLPFLMSHKVSTNSHI